MDAGEMKKACDAVRMYQAEHRDASKLAPLSDKKNYFSLNCLCYRGIERTISDGEANVIVRQTEGVEQLNLLCWH
jgi:hypothetical protein